MGPLHFCAWYSLRTITHRVAVVGVPIRGAEMKVANIPLIDQPVSMSADIFTRAFYVGNIVNYSVQLVFTDTPTGTFKLQCSNDDGGYTGSTRSAQTDSVVNWTDVGDSTLPVSSAGTHVWNVQNCGYMWARVVYTSSAPGGSLASARLFVKGV